MPETPEPTGTTGKPMPYYEYEFWDGLGTLYATNPHDNQYPLTVGYEQRIRRFSGMELPMLAESARADHLEAILAGAASGPSRSYLTARTGTIRGRISEPEKDILARLASTPDAFDVG